MTWVSTELTKASILESLNFSRLLQCVQTG